MTKASDLFAEYGSFHTDPRNRACHEIGIPLIVLALFALLSLVRIGPVDLGLVAGGAVLAYYASLDLRSALVAIVAFVALYLIGLRLPWSVAVGAFVVGWIFQFVGHRFEGRNPAFFTNLIHLLVGPLWICRLVTGRADAARLKREAAEAGAPSPRP